MLTFNHGRNGLLPTYKAQLGSLPGPFTAVFISQSDQARVNKAEWKAEASARERRRSLKVMGLRQEEAMLDEEHVTYEPGGF